MSSNNIGVPPLTLTASLRVRSQRTSLCRRQPGMNWPSISKPPGRSGSPYRQSCCSPLTRSSNETARVLPCRRGDRVRRREFITLAGIAAAAWPVMARAQQPKIPVIGFIDSRSPEALGERLRKFRQGLKDSGYGEGENAAIEYRWADGQYDRLPSLVAELIDRRVTLIVAATPVAALAAKPATTS